MKGLWFVLLAFESGAGYGLFLLTRWLFFLTRRAFLNPDTGLIVAILVLITCTSISVSLLLFLWILGVSIAKSLEHNQSPWYRRQK